MKKLLALIAVIAVLMLAGCGQKATGDYNPNYNWVSFSLGNSSFASASTTQMMPGNIRTITLTNPNTMPIKLCSNQQYTLLELLKLRVISHKQ